MNTIIKRIQNNVILTILTTLFLGITIFFISKLLADITIPFFKNYFELNNFYTKNTVFKFYILILSIITILFLNKGSLKNYGFNFSKNTNYFKLTFISIGITLGAMIVGGALFMGILSHFFPTENTNVFPKSESLIELILAIWIWSSICEEILVRGLMQGFMNHLKTKKVLGLSLPVIISGLFFGSMHLSLISAGMGVWFVCFILFNTTIIGLLAAFYREKSESLIPPILIHIIANVVGSIPLIIQMIIS
jgi:membrane protease YdiL (CAAX protease family)